MTIEKLNLEKIAILSSGGVESSVLLAHYAEDHLVQPVYVKAGFVYESEEIAALQHFIEALKHPHISPVFIFETNLANLFQDSWMTSGKNIPDVEDDTSVIIPGRNCFLLTMAALWCGLNDCKKIAIGCTGCPGFYDQERLFIKQCEHSLSHGINHSLKILMDFRNQKKAEIIKANIHLPLHKTLSCISAKHNIHCGVCNKCLERRHGFKDAGVQDLTSYATS